jgi:putative effector of murein hydrolase LrgA (UPF0299 family)
MSFGETRFIGNTVTTLVLCMILTTSCAAKFGLYFIDSKNSSLVNAFAFLYGLLLLSFITYSFVKDSSKLKAIALVLLFVPYIVSTLVQITKANYLTSPISPALPPASEPELEPQS